MMEHIIEPERARTTSSGPGAIQVASSLYAGQVALLEALAATYYEMGMDAVDDSVAPTMLAHAAVHREAALLLKAQGKAMEARLGL